MKAPGLFVFLAFFSLTASLTACQAGWMDRWKEYLSTQAASQTTSALSAQDRQDFISLYRDLADSRTNCSDVKWYLERHRVLMKFEKSFNLQTGFLFDELMDYDHQNSLFQQTRNSAETVAFTVVSAWKTKFSLSEIQNVITKVRECYPYSEDT